MKRIACLLALLLLLIGSTASAEQDYDDLYVSILGLSAVGPAYDEDFDDLPEAAQALYVAAIFDMEMRCGGLCTFFCNEGPAAATRVSDSLRPVSYTHLDVYKRQAGGHAQPRRQPRPQPRALFLFQVHHQKHGAKQHRERPTAHRQRVEKAGKRGPSARHGGKGAHQQKKIQRLRLIPHEMCIRDRFQTRRGSCPFPPARAPL